MLPMPCHIHLPLMLGGATTQLPTAKHLFFFAWGVSLAAGVCSATGTDQRYMGINNPQEQPLTNGWWELVHKYPSSLTRPPHLSGLTLGCVFDKDLQSFPSEIKKQSPTLVTFIGCLHFPVLLPLHLPTHLPDKLLALKFCVKICFWGNPNSETCLPNSYLPLNP